MQFLFSLAAIALAIISIFMKEGAQKIIGMLILIGSVALCSLYMLEGIIETAICNANMSRGGYTTTAFVPFLVQLILMITHFIIPGLAKNMPKDVKYSEYENVCSGRGNAPYPPLSGEEKNVTDKSAVPIHRNMD